MVCPYLRTHCVFLEIQRTAHIFPSIFPSSWYLSWSFGFLWSWPQQQRNSSTRRSPFPFKNNNKFASLHWIFEPSAEISVVSTLTNRLPLSFTDKHQKNIYEASYHLSQRPSLRQTYLFQSFCQIIYIQHKHFEIYEGKLLRINKNMSDS